MDNSTQPDNSEQLLSALQKYWGYNEFRPLQQEAMESILARRDSLVVLPTGGGKSLCYQAPAVCLKGTAVVVSPLISLMKDQVDAALACGIPSALINSTMTPLEQRETIEELRAGRFKLLYVSPERLVQPEFLRLLESVNVSLFAIDEAHCVSQWGHDFRPHYRQLKVLRERFSHVGVHAFTATATEQVREDIQAQLNLAQPQVLVGSFDRPNLTYHVSRKGKLQERIEEILKRHRGEAGIIYCITRAEVDRWTTILQHAKHRVRPYHAGLTDETRKKNQEAFIRDKVEVIVATVAFGMGIDKSNVRFVIHAGMPQSLEHFQQESGRAGRDGLPSDCYLFFGGDDLRKWQQIFSDQPPDVRRISTRSLNAITDFCEGVHCRHRLIVQHFGQDLDEDCGSHCDLCRENRPQLPDSLLIGQKILSSVYRQEQRFGAEYTALVLRGSLDQRILENRHDQLSTWGLLKQYSKQLIQSWIGQLTQQGFLCRTEEQNVLQITEAGRALLKGEQIPRLLGPGQGAKQSVTASSSDDPAAWEGIDRGLFERLRAERTDIAQERGVPAYLILNDATLRALAAQRPANLERLLLVPGIGQKKANDFGELILHIIRTYSEEHDLSISIDVATRLAKRQPVPPTAAALSAFPLFEAKVSLESVIDLQKKSRSTVLGYLTQYLENTPTPDLSPWVDAETERMVVEAIAVTGDDRLKPIYLHLNEKIDYDTIRLVVAARRERPCPAP